jgi:hypothetical protein
MLSLATNNVVHDGVALNAARTRPDFPYYGRPPARRSKPGFDGARRCPFPREEDRKSPVLCQSDAIDESPEGDLRLRTGAFTRPVDHGANRSWTGEDNEMITIPQLTAQALGSFLARETEGQFRSSDSDLTRLLPYAARLALECIGNSDALYHDIEHTMLVTLVGHDILAGRALQRTTTATDYANFIMACLTHDIGYVRGIVQGDEDGAYVADLTGRKIELPVGSSDAALAPYHVDRSKLFVTGRLDDVEEVDAARIARAIEYTRFPYATTPKDNDDLNEEEGLLLRAADLIGQLGDPNYMRKSNALFYEFEEIGLNKTLGYGTPADIVYKFPQFYWTNVAPQINLAIRYLNVTSRGRQWIANLHSNVFRAEREVNLTGPQR